MRVRCCQSDGVGSLKSGKTMKQARRETQSRVERPHSSGSDGAVPAHRAIGPITFTVTVLIAVRTRTVTPATA
jgi:hypothetical protein